MYGELIRALRETDFSDGCPCGAERLCKNKDCVILQAADAIEALEIRNALYLRKQLSPIGCRCQNRRKEYMSMKIEITYSNGEKYTALLTDESYANVFGCLLDDISVSVLHNMGNAEENE